MTSHLLDNDRPFPFQALMSFVYRLAKVRGHRSTWSGCIMRETEKEKKTLTPVQRKSVYNNNLSPQWLYFRRNKQFTVWPLARVGKLVSRNKTWRCIPFSHVTEVMWQGHWPLSSSCRSEAKAVSASVSAVKRRSPRWSRADSSINTESTSWQREREREREWEKRQKKTDLWFGKIWTRLVMFYICLHDNRMILFTSSSHVARAQCVSISK